MLSKHIYVIGKVQGVGYRRFAQLRARELGLKGWVRNLADGRVEIGVTGDEGMLKRYFAELKHGPTFSKVDDLEISDLAETVDSDDFVIL